MRVYFELKTLQKYIVSFEEKAMNRRIIGLIVVSVLAIVSVLSYKLYDETRCNNSYFRNMMSALDEKDVLKQQLVGAQAGSEDFREAYFAVQKRYAKEQAENTLLNQRLNKVEKETEALSDKLEYSNQYAKYMRDNYLRTGKLY